jgi:hypothetical protein
MFEEYQTLVLLVSKRKESDEIIAIVGRGSTYQYQNIVRSNICYALTYRVSQKDVYTL